jgi:2-iminobutanoate/2-iminopropanoate deaminase
VSTQAVSTMGAPAPLGAYAQGVVAAGLLFCASQLPLDPTTGEVVDGGAFEQAVRCLLNLHAVAQAAETGLEQAVRTTVYFADRAVLADVDRAFAQWFSGQPPARVPVHVVSLSRAALVSMDAIVAVA